MVAHRAARSFSVWARRTIRTRRKDANVAANRAPTITSNKEKGDQRIVQHYCSVRQPGNEGNCRCKMSGLWVLWCLRSFHVGILPRCLNTQTKSIVREEACIWTGWNSSLYIIAPSAKYLILLLYKYSAHCVPDRKSEYRVSWGQGTSFCASSWASYRLWKQ